MPCRIRASHAAVLVPIRVAWSSWSQTKVARVDGTRAEESQSSSGQLSAGRGRGKSALQESRVVYSAVMDSFESLRPYAIAFAHFREHKTRSSDST